MGVDKSFFSRFTQRRFWLETFQAMLAGLLLFGGLVLISRTNYVLFHSLSEIIALVIAFSIFTILWYARIFLDNDTFLFIGIAYFFVAALDALHTLAYPGLGVYPGNDANLSTQLRIAARYVQAISLIIAVFIGKRSVPQRAIFWLYTAVMALLLASIFAWHLFPVCYTSGIGLTPFMIVSEYLFSGAMLVVMVLFYRRRGRFNRQVLFYFLASLGVTILSELAFSAFINIYQYADLLGHLLRIVAYLLLGKAVIDVGLTRPYELLFRDLKQSRDQLLHVSTHDALTGIYNRAYFEAQMMRVASSKRFPVTIMMADLDNLKEINDRYGHPVGDEVLKHTAQVLLSAFRLGDIVARVGGDEFAALLPGIGSDVAEDVRGRVLTTLETYNDAHPQLRLRLSFGIATAETPASLSEAYRKADQAMYVEKLTHKAGFYMS